MITVENVSVEIAGKQLLREVSFVAKPGEVTGLIGPNGAGKSTMLAVLSGDLDRTDGAVRIMDADPATTSNRAMARLRAVMLQDVSVSFEFLVRDVVAMGRRPWEGTDLAQYDEELIDAALVATDTAHLAGRDVVTLSGGEKARIALARVLAQHTPVIFLDEPTAALDIKHQEQVLGLVRRIAKETNVAVLVVLHDLNAAAAYCDHIVCLANGTVTAQGRVDEVYTRETLSQVYGWPIDVRIDAEGRRSVHPARRQEIDTATAFLRAISDAGNRGK
ncbi:iron-related transport system ATP-binding protein [Corynebacterium kutscheri]|uniref:ABC-type hemin transport system, ATPase component n=1 Tax=Corynebacterium kutscheri TaxID=35755 RepID=A0A0F6R0U7_9CORY|nr:heme ABC transporter ATP-binding protein [Corynebacterium kutscheri]AKE40658.1 ABC-type hemin transport system, ATPase component [Corynebacterium kutscheri]VEH04763.1 iron-related transport system ATP-binding protein [Corynebacterium kutscheri]VEH11055.1 iron-related transport system ATP-binding protein [Corynebacterium kutscheri]VEH80467.1 iron-related transport system ATP-binding protein [Corynebacterium kutscheri]